MSKLGRKYVGVALLTLLALTLAPISMIYAQKPEDKRAEKFVELAERAGDKVQNFLELIYANETAIETITAEGLYEELEDNKTLFTTWGLGNLTEAHEALEAGDFAGAIANATEALSIFREVFKAVNNILKEAGIERGRLVQAQGLIEAMKRALARIERLREIAPEDVLPILDAAKAYLDITEARVWLSQGRINETAKNMTQANNLISLAHSLLKRKAAELNIKRLGGYLKLLEKHYNITWRLADKLKAEELKNRLEEDVWPFIEDAKEYFEEGEYSEAITNLIKARNTLKEIERDLAELRRR